MLKNMLLVGTGAFIGAVLRYSITLIPTQTANYYKTLLINVAGSFILTIIVKLVEKHWFNQDLFLLLGTGLCGGFTTFSTFSLEFTQLLDRNQWQSAITYAMLSVILSLLAIIAGRYLLR